MMIRWTAAVAAVAMAGCAALELETKPAVDQTKSEQGKAEGWTASDSPFGFTSSLEQRLASLPQSGQATNIPWASSYWPTYEDNINHRWDGPNSDSPAKKYEKAFGLTGVEDAVSLHHGIDGYKSRKACSETSECDSKLGEACAKRAGQTRGYCIPTWWGICHAWAPAAILLPEPKYPVTMNGVTFKVNDLKALVSLVHNSTSTKFVSLRCENDHGQGNVTFDEHGRPTGGSAACRDTNPGTFHLLITNYLGILKQSFVFDRTFDDEVWNQPLRGYRITQQREVTSAEANRLVGATLVGGTSVTKRGTVAKTVWAHQGSFPVTAGQTFKVVMTGSNDADLYVKFGAQPTEQAFDCRPYDGTSNETCELTVPAGATQAFVSVQGYAESSDFQLVITSGGAAPTAYAFNPNAVKLFHVKAEVDWITEASSSTDGNLSASIDSYTRTDRYEYLLEVDSAGKVIGGEWLGASKTAHPDFVWLPIGPRGASVAGGKITYARVKELLDKSLVPPGGGTTAGEKTVSHTGLVIAKGAWKHFGPFQVAPGKPLTATLGGTGDADLYVRKAAAPSLTAYDCRPYQGNSTESCTVLGPGAVYVSVNGYATTSTVDLVVKYTEGTGSTPPVDPPAGITHLNVTGTVALGESKVFTLAVPAGAKLVIKTEAPNDVDLYIQLNAAPTTSAYLLRGYTESGNETINWTAPSSGTLHVMVHGYAASSFKLTTANQ